MVVETHGRASLHAPRHIYKRSTFDFRIFFFLKFFNIWHKMMKITIKSFQQDINNKKNDPVRGQILVEKNGTIQPAPSR